MGYGKMNTFVNIVSATPLKDSERPSLQYRRGAAGLGYGEPTALDAQGLEGVSLAQNIHGEKTYILDI
jgi:hypothetical protein